MGSDKLELVESRGWIWMPELLAVCSKKSVDGSSLILRSRGGLVTALLPLARNSGSGCGLGREFQKQKHIRDGNPEAEFETFLRETEVEESRRRLGEIKRELAALKPGEKDAKKRERLLLRTPKGTRDYGAGEIFCRDYVERIVKECFVLYGGAQLDTPVFERKDILAGKYGEDAKLIFDLEDQRMFYDPRGGLVDGATTTLSQLLSAVCLSVNQSIREKKMELCRAEEGKVEIVRLNKTRTRKHDRLQAA
ncbi:hypothetical protein EDB85DRAFT_1891619 [Lactarius pseudohatsudake]|nr:hypothetical protein EDB85DRAFT_1891619 [Lactarius pseudohatsudake]